MNRISPYSCHAQRRAGWKVAALAFSVSLSTLGLVPGSAQALQGLDEASPSVAAARAAAGAPGAMTDRLIIKYRDMPAAAGSAATADAAVAVAANRAGVRIHRLRDMAAPGAHVMKLDRQLDMSALQTLAGDIQAGDRAIEYVEPDWIMKPQWLPNDPQFGAQWHYTEADAGINLPAAWDESKGEGVVVAVIDTGVRPHVDLKENLLPGYDFIGDAMVANDGGGRDSDASDPGDQCPLNGALARSSWHGTHVAGTIAATTHNAIGVSGVAPGARILPLRVMGRCGGYLSDITDAIVWAAGGKVTGLPVNPHPAKVVNLSLGAAVTCGATMSNAIRTARDLGSVVVVAAGNSKSDASNFTPASCEGVISVAAVNRKGARAYYSNFGNSVDVAAPGGDALGSILSTANDGNNAPGADAYRSYAGTSMAAPHVAGVAALMLGIAPALTPDEVESLLKSSAALRGFPVACNQCGTGIVDARRAIDAVKTYIKPPPPIPALNAEVEPNNSAAQPNDVTALPATLNGTIKDPSDLDFFRVTVPAGKLLTVTLTGNPKSDFDLFAYNSVGQELAKSARLMGKVDHVQVRNLGKDPLPVTLKVNRYSGLFGLAAPYALSLKLE